MPDTITSPPGAADQAERAALNALCDADGVPFHATPCPELARPDFTLAEILIDLADQVNVLCLSLGGLRAECGGGHDRSFDSVEMLAGELRDYCETLRSWANGRQPEWAVGTRAARLLGLLASIEAAAASLPEQEARP